MRETLKPEGVNRDWVVGVKNIIVMDDKCAGILINYIADIEDKADQKGYEHGYEDAEREGDIILIEELVKIRDKFWNGDEISWTGRQCYAKLDLRIRELKEGI